MIRKQVQSLTLDKIVVESRASDHFINATQLCKAGNKKFNNWFQLESTKELIKALQDKIVYETGIPGSQIPQVIEVKRGNSSRFSQGSWVHPDLAIQLAQWISPHFALQVSAWIRELFATGSVQIDSKKTDEEIKRLEDKAYMLEQKLVEKNFLLEQKTALFDEQKGQLQRLYDFNVELITYKKLKERRETVYIVSTYNYMLNGMFKIGRTKNLKNRSTSHNTTHVNGDRVEVLAEHMVNNAKLVEETIHKKLEGLRVANTAEFYMCPFDLLSQLVELIVNNDHEANEMVNRIIDAAAKLKISIFDPQDWCSGIDVRKTFPYVFPESEYLLLDSKESTELASFDVSKASKEDKKAFVQECIRAYRRNILKLSDEETARIVWKALHPYLAEHIDTHNYKFKSSEWYQIAKEAAEEDGRSVVLYRAK
jgi:hypothetical protein